MRIYISIDIEGVAGAVITEQTSPGGADYPRFRRLMTLEANAAVEACVNAGVDDVVVNDAHGPMVNLLVEELHPAARLVTGRTKLHGMMEAIDGGFDGCFMLGYHQREGGGDGVLNHTVRSQIVYEVRVNGDPVGELELNAWLAGTHGVPVVLVTGDDALCEDAAKSIPGVVIVPVKQAIDRFAAVTLSSQEARSRISSGAVDALAALHEGSVEPLRPPSSIALEVDFKRTAPANMAQLIPGIERVGPRTVAFATDDYVEAYRAFSAVCIVGGAAWDGQP
jgi:D-amino peptidase